MGVDSTLSERGVRYGDFAEQARIAQAIKSAMESGVSWPDMSDDKKESLHMIAGKLARIVNGDPEYADSWHDVGGYSRLVELQLIAGDSNAE